MMLLHEGLTHIQPQIKPRLLFGESFSLIQNYQLIVSVFIMIHEKQVQLSVLVFLKLYLFWQTSVADLKKIKVLWLVRLET